MLLDKVLKKLHIKWNINAKCIDQKFYLNYHLVGQIIFLGNFTLIVRENLTAYSNFKRIVFKIQILIDISLKLNN